jgi:GTP cyclohydrolase II
MKLSSHAHDVRRVASTVLPTKWGIFRMIGFERQGPAGAASIETAVVLVTGEPGDPGDPARGVPLLRIHSQCFTGEVLGSLRCDCGAQLELAIRIIAENGTGLLVYEYQEGRGIGLMAKLQAYALQDKGLDTIAANHALGFETDCRDFSLPTAVLNHLGVHRVRLLSNNPEKVRALINAGIEVVEQIPCEIPPNPHARAYLQIKKERMVHTLTLV